MISSDLCPICGVLRETEISGYRTTSIDAEGKKKTTLTRVYHCRTCSGFVRCEDVDDTPQNRESVILDDEIVTVEEREVQAVAR